MKLKELRKLIREEVNNYNDYDYLNPPKNVRFHTNHNDYFHAINNYFGKNLKQVGYKGKDGNVYPAYKKGKKVVGVFDLDQNLGWTLNKIDELLVGVRDWETYTRDEWTYDLLVDLFYEKFGFNIKDEEWVGLYYDDIKDLFLYYAASNIHSGDKVFKKVLKILAENGHEILDGNHKNIAHKYIGMR